MNGRSSITKLLDAERMFLETIRHDSKKTDEVALCVRRMGIYQKLLLVRDISDFKSETEIDEFKNEVDDIVREFNRAHIRYERAVAALLAVPEKTSLAAE